MTEQLFLQHVPEIGGFYYHYKHDPNGPIGNYAYEVINLGYHTEIDDFDEAAMVVYRPLYAARVYKAGKRFDVRPLAMFMEDVTKEGKTFPRFTLITDERVIGELKKIRKDMYGE